MREIIFYGSYLAFPFLALSVYFGYIKRGLKLDKYFKITVFTIFTLLSLVFIYARFIEKNLIVTKNTDVNVGFKAKVIVISDIHLGAYNNSHFLDRIVDKINKIEGVDAVMIAGDSTYYPSGDLNSLFKPLGRIKHPVYAVLGNHDSEQPGPYLRDKLKIALEAQGVKFLYNQVAEIDGGRIKVLGLGDDWAGEDEVSMLNNFSKDDNVIVIAHNPDTTIKYQSSNADLTLSGHTHGGQIRIPFFYKSQIPSAYGFNQGLYKLNKKDGTLTADKYSESAPAGDAFGQVYVSSGTGVIGLPMRLGIPPVIDVLNLK